jgi:hypothetical protein
MDMVTVSLPVWQGSFREEINSIAPPIFWRLGALFRRGLLLDTELLSRPETTINQKSGSLGKHCQCLGVCRGRGEGRNGHEKQSWKGEGWRRLSSEMIRLWMER